MPGPNIHVTPYGEQWVVRCADEGEPKSEHLLLTEAVDAGRVLAAAARVELVVYDEDWTVVGVEDFNSSR